MQNHMYHLQHNSRSLCQNRAYLEQLYFKAKLSLTVWQFSSQLFYNYCVFFVYSCVKQDVINDEAKEKERQQLRVNYFCHPIIFSSLLSQYTSLQIIFFSEQVICQSRGKFWLDTKFICWDHFIFVCTVVMYTVLSLTMPQNNSYIVHCV